MPALPGTLPAWPTTITSFFWEKSLCLMPAGKDACAPRDAACLANHDHILLLGKEPLFNASRQGCLRSQGLLCFAHLSGGTKEVLTFIGISRPAYSDHVYEPSQQLSQPGSLLRHVIVEVANLE